MSKKNKKINLMIALNGLHHGGAERVVATLCKYLDADRYSVTVCWRTACGAIGKELIDQGYELIGIPELEPNVTPFRRFLVLKKLLREKQIDIIHTHDPGSLADAAQCRLLGSKTRLLHTFHFGNYPHRNKSHLLIEMIFSRMANQLVAVGFEQAKLIRRSLHLSSSKLQTIYNGVEIPAIEPGEGLVAQYRNKSDRSVVIGSISTLTEQKGLTYLLDAAKILRQRDVNCIFLVAGDGPLREELEEKCKRLNLENRVFFLGWVPNAANRLLHDLDIFCQPSLWEANSIVLLEAMASGLPIVTTKVGESIHVIDEGKNGKIVDSRDPMMMADVLTELVNKPKLRELLGNNAQQKFLNNYTIDKMIANYEQAYERLM